MKDHELARRRVFDPVQRILHGWIGFSTVSLIGLGWVAKLCGVGGFKRSLTEVHMALGFALAVGFALRVLWGIVGPRQARFHAIGAAMSRTLVPSHPPRPDDGAFGYEGPASFAYGFLYLILACAVVSGLLLAAMRHDAGPFAERLFDDLTWQELSSWAHECALYGATLFVAAHVTGMILHEGKAGAPVAQAMVSGYQYRWVPQKKEVSREP